MKLIDLKKTIRNILKEVSEEEKELDTDKNFRQLGVRGLTQSNTKFGSGINTKPRDEYERIKAALGNIDQIEDIPLRTQPLISDTEVILINNVIDAAEKNNVQDFFINFSHLKQNINNFKPDLKKYLLSCINIIKRPSYYLSKLKLNLCSIVIPKDNKYGITPLKDEGILGTWFSLLKPVLWRQINTFPYVSEFDGLFKNFFRNSMYLFLSLDDVNSTNFPKIIDLDLGGCMFMEKETIKKISSFNNIRHLILKHCYLNGNQDLTQLSELNNIKILDIRHNSFSYHEIERIVMSINQTAKDFSKNNTIKILVDLNEIEEMNLLNDLKEQDLELNRDTRFHKIILGSNYKNYNNNSISSRIIKNYLVDRNQRTIDAFHNKKTTCNVIEIGGDTSADQLEQLLNLIQNGSITVFRIILNNYKYEILTKEDILRFRNDIYKFNKHIAVQI